MSQGPPEIPHFEYRGDIGAGGFAMVHRYYDRNLKDDVAVKVPKSAVLSDAVRERFIAEGESMAKLRKHPNVVTVYGTGTAADGRPYLVMEYCPGGDLAKVAGRAPLSLKEVLDIGVQVAGAIETAHERGMLHRDIKPANVLMNEYQRPCLTDFGIASRLAERDADAEVALSLPWSAPELLDRSAVERDGIPSEVFSFAATLWHLMVGHSPFMPPGADNSSDAIEQRIVSGWLPNGLTGPADLQRLLLRALSKNPAARPGSLHEFAAGLQRIQKAQRFRETELELTPVSAPEPEPVRAAFVAPPPPISPPTQRKLTPVAEYEPPLPRSVTQSPQTAVRPARTVGPAQTTVRPAKPTVMPKSSTVESGAPKRWPLYAAGALAAVAIVGVGIFLLSGEDKGGGGPVVATIADVPDQNAGAGDAPPGRPAITATRLDGKTVRFTWNYSAQQATDTFSWRTSDGVRSGVEKQPQVDVEGANPVCLQVKVVRADGGNATADWSQESCG
ncbi:serine/threonine-protein kinase [Lentzea sp. NPDC059081]|uniref:serine/threonine-protein kinase n=1 Tax=Lentzea sp. NPDC059081 TaxID=3346719 RepID=UPI00367F03C2